MNKKATVALAVIIGLAAISVPIAISLYLAWKQSFDEQMATVASLAEDVLRRSDGSTDQTFMIFKALADARTTDPCSVENIRLMAKLDLTSEQVQAVGYVRDDHLLCSSFGHHNTPLGAPTFVTPYGTAIRTSVEFPVLPGKRFLVSTDIKSGYAVAIHPNLPLDVFVSVLCRYAGQGCGVATIDIFPSLTPELNVRDIRKALDFYTELLGFTICFERPEDRFATIELNGAFLMLEQVTELAPSNDPWTTATLEYPFGRGVNLQIKVTNVDEIYNRLVKYQYPIQLSLEQKSYRIGNNFLTVRQFMVMDPDGYLIRLSTFIGENTVDVLRAAELSRLL